MSEEEEHSVQGSNEKKLTVTIDATKIKEEMKKLTDAESRIKELEAQAEANKHKIEFFDKESGKGSLPAGLLNQGEGFHSEGQKEFEDFPSMVEYLKKHDGATYEKLFAKGIQALRANPHSFEYKDPWVNGVSCVKKAINDMNERARGNK